MLSGSGFPCSSKDIVVDDDDCDPKDDLYALLRTPSDINLEKEFAWLQQAKCLETFDRVLRGLRQCCLRLHMHSKVDPAFDVRPSHPKTVQLSLSTKTAGNEPANLKSNVVLLGDNVIQCEVQMKNKSSPGGVFRAIAQPEVQWKLQQLQDLQNHIARAVHILMEATIRANAIKLTKKWDLDAGIILLRASKEARHVLATARDCVMVPKKRTLLELTQYPPTNSLLRFNPPLPLAEMTPSLYVSGTNLVFALYTATPHKAEKISVAAVECPVPGLYQVVQFLSSSVKLLQDLIYTMDLICPRV